VEPVPGEPFSFDVQSRRRVKMVHRVQIDAFAFNGRCSCEAFTFDCLPLLLRGALPSSGLRCWHIGKARDYWIEWMGPQFAKKFYGAGQNERQNREHEEVKRDNSVVRSDPKRQYQMNRAKSYVGRK
jgi:hypothetical protein